jgi:DNA-directed RNA polymerase specialized sigma24 family protein
MHKGDTVIELQASYTTYLKTGQVDDLLVAIKPIILSSIRGILKPHQRVDEDDLAQAILVEVWTKLEQCTGNIKAWLRTVTRSRCMDHVRRMRRSYEDQPDGYEAEAKSTGHTFVLPNNLTDRERLVADRLSNGDRVRDIAEVLGLTTTTVQRSIGSIRKKCEHDGTRVGDESALVM